MKSTWRKTRFGRVVVMAVTALVLGAVPVSAGTIVGVIDWDTNVPNPAWTANDPDVSVSVDPGDGDQWLRIAFEDGDPQTVLVSGSAAGLFAGTWRSEFWVEFDFWSAGTPPDALQVRWGADGSDDVWAYSLTPTSGSGWQTLRTASFGNVGEWMNVGAGDPSDYLADLSSIDWIGVYIDRGTTSGAESYGIDDFSLMVPEPAEIMLLAAAFGVGLMVWRRMRLVSVGC